jgi:hypothetical protein
LIERDDEHVRRLDERTITPLELFALSPSAPSGASRLPMSSWPEGLEMTVRTLPRAGPRWPCRPSRSP